MSDLGLGDDRRNDTDVGDSSEIGDYKTQVSVE